MDSLEAKLHDISAPVILDVATGRGNALDSLLAAAPENGIVVGVDLSRLGMVTARPNRPRAKLHLAQMDAGRLGFPAGTFDLVSLSMSMHHLTELRGVLEDMLRVLPEGGYLLVAEMYRSVDTHEQQTHVLLHDWWAEIDLSLGKPHYPTFERNEIARILEGLNLQQVWSSEISGPENDDPTDPEKVDILLNVCDEYIERAKQHAKAGQLVARGQELKKRVTTVGLLWAPAVVYLGRKGS
jgi:ubiquinone/menaquinone biosynthesis C-methylase UbiE